MRFRLVVDGDPREIDLARDSKGVAVRVDGSEYRVRTKSTKEGITVRLGSGTHRIRFHGHEAIVDDRRHTVSIGDVTEDRPGKAPAARIHRSAIE